MAARLNAQLRVESGGLAREVVAFGEAGSRSSSVGVEPGGGHWVTVPFVEVRRDGGEPGQGGVEPCKGGQPGPRAGGLANRDGPVEAGCR